MNLNFQEQKIDAFIESIYIKEKDSLAVAGELNTAWVREHFHPSVDEWGLTPYRGGSLILTPMKGGE